LPALTVFTQHDRAHFGQDDIELYPASHPLQVAGPLSMGRPGPASVDPVQVFAHVNKVTVPGEQKHLAGNLLVLVIITPACRGVRIAHVLLRARPEQLSPICIAKATRTVRYYAFGIYDYHAVQIIATFRQQYALSHI